jgi:hypothetical protein
VFLFESLACLLNLEKTMPSFDQHYNAIVSFLCSPAFNQRYLPDRVRKLVDLYPEESIRLAAQYMTPPSRIDDRLTEAQSAYFLGWLFDILGETRNQIPYFLNAAFYFGSIRTSACLCVTMRKYIEGTIKTDGQMAMLQKIESIEANSNPILYQGLAQFYDILANTFHDILSHIKAAGFFKLIGRWGVSQIHLNKFNDHLLVLLSDTMSSSAERLHHLLKAGELFDKFRLNTPRMYELAEQVTTYFIHQDPPLLTTPELLQHLDSHFIDGPVFYGMFCNHLLRHELYHRNVLSLQDYQYLLLLGLCGTASQCISTPTTAPFHDQLEKVVRSLFRRLESLGLPQDTIHDLASKKGVLLSQLNLKLIAPSQEAASVTDVSFFCVAGSGLPLRGKTPDMPRKGRGSPMSRGRGTGARSLNMPADANDNDLVGAPYAKTCP